MRPARPFARMRRVTRSTRATSTASISAGDFRDRPEGATATRTSRAGGGSPHRPGVAVVREGVQVPARRPPQQRDQRPLTELGHLADGHEPSVVELGCRDRAHAPQPLRPATGAGTRAPHRAAPRGGRRASPRRWPPWPGAWCRARRRSAAARRSRARRAAAAPDVRGRARRFARARGRRGRPRRSTAPRRPGGLPEDLEHRLAGLGVGLPAGLHRHSRGHSRRACDPPIAERDAVGPGLVARRQDDAGAHHHGPAAQRGGRRAARPRRRTHRGRRGGSRSDTNTCSHRAKTESRPSH